MKRYFAIMVLVVMIAAVATQVAAQTVIKGSMHDLSQSNRVAMLAKRGITVTGGYEVSGNVTNEICYFCHAPHGAAAVGTVPLWNHKTTTATYTGYTDMSGTTFTPGDASKICLSCHDGTLAIDAYNQGYPPRATGAPFGTYTDGKGTNGGMRSFAMLGTDLSSDHPVGVAYTAGADFNTVPNNTGANVVKLYNNQVECGSCHNVHRPTPAGGTGSYFLRVSNDQSALCLTCHIK